MAGSDMVSARATLSGEGSSGFLPAIFFQFYKK
jgi:hypothetical protein